MITNTPRPIRLSPPEAITTYHEWKGVVNKHFPACVTPASVCGATMAQLLINDITNPFAVALVDVPSSAKTITLNFFDIPELAYTSDNFTAASFVSSASSVATERLKEVDLLPRIRFRTLIVRDLAPLFGNKDEDLAKTIGLLIRVLDGEGLQVDSGTHGKRGYSGDYTFMLLGGTTPLSENIFKIMGKLGSRLFFLKMNSPEKDIEELVEQNVGSNYQQKAFECKTATINLFRSLWHQNPKGIDWNKQADDRRLMRAIALCAILLSRARGVVEYSKEEDEHNDATIEKPDRVNTLLYNLCRGHAVLGGRKQINASDVAVAIEVALDSSHKKRATLIRGLVENKGVLFTSDVERLLKCTKPTALKAMQVLGYLEIANVLDDSGDIGRPEKALKLHEKFQWFLEEECQQIRGTHTGEKNLINAPLK